MLSQQMEEENKCARKNENILKYIFNFFKKTWFFMHTLRISNF